MKTDKYPVLGPLVPALFFAALALIAYGEVGCSSAVTSARLSQVTPGLKADQVTTLLGPPNRIEHAEITGVVGDVYYYAGRPGNAKVVLINGVVFSTQLEPGDRA